MMFVRLFCCGNSFDKRVSRCSARWVVGLCCQENSTTHLDLLFSSGQLFCSGKTPYMYHVQCFTLDGVGPSILTYNPDLGRGGSTAVTAILINGQVLWVANVGDSRALLSGRGQEIQMSVDHEPNTERGSFENKVGFVSNMPGYNSTRWVPEICQRSVLKV
ncbi:uncharacterized protein LOC141690323 isoform X2 [Apium graveolens]|uniref:uncharacterized protein LOC141690323 isoform X2 n=1 Tax=Apium graveolens TaxID=4045 RepID=UPI003D7AC76B